MANIFPVGLLSMLLSQEKLTKMQGGIKSAESYYLLLKGPGFLDTTLSHLVPFAHTLEYFKAKDNPRTSPWSRYVETNAT